MARIAGVDIPKDKRVEIALRSIYGIGPTLSRRILEQTGISAGVKVRELTDDEVNRIREAIDKGYRVEGDLRKEVNFNIKRLMAYRHWILPRSQASPRTAGSWAAH